MKNLKKLISLDNPIRLWYHLIKAIFANIFYWFPSKDMTVIWVTWTNWKTTTCNIIAKWLRSAGKKVFMFTTVNIIIDNKEYVNNTKMTSPESFELQRLLKIAKSNWCDTAIIETASHWILMHRIWWINYDTLVLTNITQDHLDLHRTMDNYVNTKLSIFKKLITSKRRWSIKKVAILNNESLYIDLFKNETYDQMYTYWVNNSSWIMASDVKYSKGMTKFNLTLPWEVIEIETNLIWEFNISNILAAIWVFITYWIKSDIIKKAISEIKSIPWRMEEIENEEDIKIYVDYAHSEDALEKVLTILNDIKWKWNITTVFWATWDRDRLKRPLMWAVVSKLSDKVILTRDDDYSEDIEQIIKDVLPWIERKQWENFWIIKDRKSAIETAIIWSKPGDIVLCAWKWDEHVIVTNEWSLEWNDKAEIKKILKELDNNKQVK